MALAKYDKLISDLKKILEKGRSRAENVAKQIVVETYWEMGRRMNQEGFEAAALKQVAEDLNLESSLVSRIVRFYQLWPKSCPACPGGQPGHFTLSWSHFKEVLALPDRQREFYLQTAWDEKWGRDKLAAKIKDGYFEKVQAEGVSAKKGQRGKAGAGAMLEPIDSPLFTYGAIVERVIDGDTLLLRIDLGFNVWKEERVRLRGIDCPEMDTKEGVEARDFVAGRLKQCPRVVVRSKRRVDIYGRFVVDVFYLEDEDNRNFILEKGKYLNRELLEKGLAVLF